MGTLRIMFKRGQEVKYLSHLDILRVFDRAFRRAGIPLAYSMGFNPRPKVVFGLPLGVGVTSEAEYADMTLEGDIEYSSIKELLNKNMPIGFEIIDSGLVDGRKNIMTAIDAALYDILIEFSDELPSDLESILLQSLEGTELWVVKKKKNKEEKINIMPLLHCVKSSIINKNEYNSLQSGYNSNCEMIFNMDQDRYLINEAMKAASLKDCSYIYLTALVAAGSRGNLKSELLADAVINRIGLKARIPLMHRRGLFVKENERFIRPL